MESLSLLLKERQREGKLTGIQVSKSIKILHILFVDDVIIMIGATIHEWWEIDKVLKFFILTSSLLINASKSTLACTQFSTWIFFDLISHHYWTP